MAVPLHFFKVVKMHIPQPSFCPLDKPAPFVTSNFSRFEISRPDSSEPEPTGADPVCANVCSRHRRSSSSALASDSLPDRWNFQPGNSARTRKCQTSRSPALPNTPSPPLAPAANTHPASRPPKSSDRSRCTSPLEAVKTGVLNEASLGLAKAEPADDFAQLRLLKQRRQTLEESATPSVARLRVEVEVQVVDAAHAGLTRELLGQPCRRCRGR